MSVHVTDTSDPLAWVIVDDDNGHVGTAASSTVSYGRNIDGSENLDQVVITCPEPGCGTVSYWPRESLPPIVQEALFPA
jgi:hypothetical protein